MTKPRMAFLRGCRGKGAHSVPHYPPAKWATEQGFVDVRHGRLGGDTYVLNAAGEEALAAAEGKK